MSDLERKTKAELIKIIEENEEKASQLDVLLAANKAQIAIDMGFRETKEEEDERKKRQQKKDYIKRMTHGRWVSQEKFEVFLQEQNRKVRQ